MSFETIKKNYERGLDKTNGSNGSKKRCYYT